MAERGDRPVPASDAVREKFRRQRHRDTGCELAVRRALHRRGLRYRVDKAPLIGVRRRADIVFTKARVAVFVDGCFWHGCADHRTVPANNRAWWTEKIEANRARDRHTDELLAANGWQVVRAWEHDDPESVANKVEAALREAYLRGRT